MADAMQESSIWETLLVDFSLGKKTFGYDGTGAGLTSPPPNSTVKLDKIHETTVSRPRRAGGAGL